MEKIVKRIGLVYYLIYTSTILTTIAGYLLTMNSDENFDSKSELGIALKSIIILYTLISLPLALGGFFRMTKKWIAIENENEKFNQYKKGAIIRLSLIGFGLIASIIVFYLFRTDISFIYCAGISAIALLFCKPSEAKMTNELHLDNSED
jgi:hypothetical protein